MMIACDVCDNWYHTGCLAFHKATLPSDADDSFVCAPCVEMKADAYLSDLQDSNDGGVMMDDFGADYLT